MRTHGISLARASAFSSVFDHREEVWLIPSPISHASGLNKVYISLLSGCTTVLLDGFMLAQRFFSAISKYNVTVIHLMSAATEMYLQMGRGRGSLMGIREQIKHIFLAASPFSDTHISSLKEIFYKSKIIQTYSTTEVGGCYIDHACRKYDSFCVGQPWPGSDVVFFDEQKTHIVEPTKHDPGLFAMSGATKMLGYWKNPELTASVTRGDHIVLSDFGYKGEDGLYYFLTRADDVIISGGYKIAPLEIEDAANSFEGIRESVCVPEEDTIMGNVPKLYVVMEKDNEFNVSDIYKHLKSKLESVKVPRFIEEIDEIPKINNKINRRELRK